MTIRYSLISAISAFAISIAQGASAEQNDVGDCNITYAIIGGSHTAPHTSALTGVESLGMMGGDFVNSIIVNSAVLGGPGGNLRGSLSGTNGSDYITSIELNAGWWINSLSFTTNNGKVLKNEGVPNAPITTKLENIRLLMMGVNFGQFVNQLNLVYCEDYK